MLPALHVRSYDGVGDLHAHDFVQVVLPVSGELEIEIEGRWARLSPALSAFVAPGAAHAQAGRSFNRSLILDLPEASLPDAVRDGLGHGRFFAPSPGVRRLLDFAALRTGEVEIGEDERAALACLLTGTLSRFGPSPRPLDLLRQAIRRDPAADWHVARLAREAGVSRSGLYRLLADEGEATPGRLVTRVRLEVALGLITEPRLSLAEVALACGFSDQAALTRAMRRETGRTPGAWRRGTMGPKAGTPGQERGPVPG
ncbi:helix-turn-helix transcriptional regulator [Rubellimicrobium roseum]|uniref:Helix-turn-helix domain-containing protein n=1 Tax=Rubellimicrobium roseum TaxID=687525 RepID=A0A5C4NMR5_9RHOB|nr:AraC family transcriptional regulator [Rubellimicrobium roseum]TNC74718.1 helix-turn-helix domain-containing protein [Rubellimicrobium roseum]